MKTTSETIKMIPIERIRVINPRCRDQKKFSQVVKSIKDLGLKKPIMVSFRAKSEGEEPGYDLVYGQGRMEAFMALGHTEIPAIVTSLSKEDRLVLSLVENLVRKFPSRGDLIAEILRLKSAGYSNVQIGRKLGIADSAVGDYLSLVNAKEERLLTAALKETIPLAVAVEISKAETPAQQTAFLKAYESGRFKTTTAIRVVKRLITLRNTRGKSKSNALKADQEHSPEEMVNMYRRETHKMRSLVHKARICETKILIVINAFKNLLSDESFKNLLASQNLAKLPQPLADKLNLE